MSLQMPKINTSELKDAKPTFVLPVLATPAIDGLTEVDVTAQGAASGVDVKKDLKVPEGLTVGQTKFELKDGWVDASSKIANEKNPINPNGGDKLHLDSLIRKELLPKTEVV